MNLYKDINDSEIKLLESAGVKVVDKEYSEEDLKKVEQQIVEYIMSASLKNGDIDRTRIKYNGILDRI